MNKLRLKHLLSGLKAGKKEYFEEFYRLTKGAVWYSVLRYVKSRHHAEDVLQDTYIAFLDHLDAVRGDPLPYLCTIAKNKALDSIKKDAKLDKAPLSEDMPAETDENSFDTPLLDLCRKRLTEEDFYILENTVLFGYTRVDVAKALGKPVSTVNRRYNEILKKIKKFATEIYR